MYGYMDYLFLKQLVKQGHQYQIRTQVKCWTLVLLIFEAVLPCPDIEWDRLIVITIILSHPVSFNCYFKCLI